MERTASDTTGIPPMSIFWMTGSFIASGSSRRTAEMRARASCEASFTFTLSSNSTITEESPSRETELTCLTPGIGLTASSIRRVTSRSTLSGEAPGSSVVIETTGNSMSGNMSTARRR